jgi:hypothetical protein
MLAEAARKQFGGFKDPTLEPYTERLEELGIFKNGMVCHQKVMALNLGSVGQLWNMVRGLGKMLGISEEKMLQLAKDYNGDLDLKQLTE